MNSCYQVSKGNRSSGATRDGKEEAPPLRTEDVTCVIEWRASERVKQRSSWSHLQKLRGVREFREGGRQSETQQTNHFFAVILRRRHRGFRKRPLLHSSGTWYNRTLRMDRGLGWLRKLTRVRCASSLLFSHNYRKAHVSSHFLFNFLAGCVSLREWCRFIGKEITQIPKNSFQSYYQKSQRAAFFPTDRWQYVGSRHSLFLNCRKRRERD